MRLAPPAPWLPKSIHGKLIVVLFVCHTGRVEEGERLVAPIKAFGSPYERLVEIKTEWDPGNLFRVNKNIPPRPA